MNKRVLFIGLGVIALFAMIALGSWAKANAPAAPTPRPDAVHLRVGGGDIFIPGAHQYLLDTYNLDVESVKVDTFGTAKYVNEHPGDLQCIWLGSTSAIRLFQQQGGTILDSTTPFRTYGVVMTRKDLYLDPYWVKYGIATANSDGSYTVHFSVLRPAMQQHWTWYQLLQDQATKLGIAFTDDPNLKANEWMNQPVKVKFSDPTASSGGMSSFLMMGSYAIPGAEQGGSVITVDTVNSVLPYMVDNFVQQGSMERRSPDLFNWYIGHSSYPMVLSSESLYLGWYLGLPEGQKATADLVVPMYPEFTNSTDHVLAAIDDACRPLVAAFKNDSNLAQFGWEKGMRTLAGGIAQKPGNVTLTTIAADPFFVEEPAYEVFDAVKQALCNGPAVCK